MRTRRTSLAVPDAPTFPYPVWSIWRDDLDGEVRAVAQEALAAIKSQIETDQNAVITELAGISDVDTVEVLGNAENAK